MPSHFSPSSSSLGSDLKVGWYWGALTSEVSKLTKLLEFAINEQPFFDIQAAEKILSNEPDGSFIVRDSSDLNYIFSLTVKLNGCIRHVRIEQEQGTFSFGTCAQQIKCSYKSRTIKEFIENAVEHSRSGRYLFFIHRRPEHGPMRVQLLHPVSRFKHIQSLQHMCRYEKSYTRCGIIFLYLTKFFSTRFDYF